MLQLGEYRLHHPAQIHLLTAIYIRLKYTETMETVAPLRKQMIPPPASASWERSLAQFSNELFFHVFVLELFAHFQILDFCVPCVPDNFLNLSLDHFVLHVKTAYLPLWHLSFLSPIHVFILLKNSVGILQCIRYSSGCWGTEQKRYGKNILIKFKFLCRQVRHSRAEGKPGNPLKIQYGIK